MTSTPFFFWKWNIDNDDIIFHSEPGRLMARYCIAYDSMKQFLNIKGTESLSDMVSGIPILSSCSVDRETWYYSWSTKNMAQRNDFQVDLVSKCREFSDVKLRMNEKRVLNTLNKDKNSENVRYNCTTRWPFRSVSLYFMLELSFTMDSKLQCLLCFISFFVAVVVLFLHGKVSNQWKNQVNGTKS